MYFTFKKNNKQTEKPVNRFVQDGASTGIRSLQTSIEIKLPKSTQFNTCLKFNSIQEDKNHCENTPPPSLHRNVMTFRHLSSCGTIRVVIA